MKLGLFLLAAGHHAGGWRHPDAESGTENIDLVVRAAQAAERARFDMVFLGDRLLTRILDETEPAAAGRPSPGFLLWARNNQVSARTWWAVLLEHEGRIAAAEKYAVTRFSPVGASRRRWTACRSRAIRPIGRNRRRSTTCS